MLTQPIPSDGLVMLMPVGVQVKCVVLDIEHNMMIQPAPFNGLATLMPVGVQVKFVALEM